jgi:hypothetical protein
MSAAPTVCTAAAAAVSSAVKKAAFTHACPFLAQSRREAHGGALAVSAEALPALVTVFENTCPFLRSARSVDEQQQKHAGGAC